MYIADNMVNRVFFSIFKFNLKVFILPTEMFIVIIKLNTKFSLYTIIPWKYSCLKGKCRKIKIRFLGK